MKIPDNYRIITIIIDGKQKYYVQQFIDDKWTMPRGEFGSSFFYKKKCNEYMELYKTRKFPEDYEYNYFDNYDELCDAINLIDRGGVIHIFSYKEPVDKSEM